MKWSILFMILFVASCKSKPKLKQHDLRMDSIQKNISIVSQNDSIITIAIDAKQLPTIVNTTILYNWQHVYVQIKNITTKQITASINVKDSNRNIRVNQIIMPDSTADGPFGRSINYKTKQKGNYTLIIGKDNMAEGILKGPLSIFIQLKN